MKYLRAFLAQAPSVLKPGGAVTAKAAKSPSDPLFAVLAGPGEAVSEIEGPPTVPAPALNDHCCDDCGRPAVALLVTDYGARYCRACVYSAATAPADEPETDAQACMPGGER